MDKDGLLKILEGVATLMELKGENPFKVRAYHNAARAIEQYQDSLDKAVEKERLPEAETSTERGPRVTVYSTVSLPSSVSSS